METALQRAQFNTWRKADLHVHLEGSVSPALLQELARRNDIALQAPSVLATGASVPAPTVNADGALRLQDFTDFIRCYVKITSCLRSAADIFVVTEEFARRCQAEGIAGAEVYVTPTTFLTFGVSFQELCEGLRRGQEQARAEQGVRIRWIFDIVRNVATDGFDTLDLLCQARANGVDVHTLALAGDERSGATTQFAEVFAEAHRLGLRCLAHAGETAGAENIWDTIHHLQPDRIGHGIRAVNDASLLTYLAERQIPIEVCPWSNVLLGSCNAAEHPLTRMLDAGLNVVLCSDDPGILQKDLFANYDFAAKQGVPVSRLQSLAETSWAFSL